MASATTVFLFLALTSSIFDVLSSVHKREVTINNSVDYIIEDIKGLIRKSVNVKDVRRTFEKKMRIGKLKCNFEATQGQLYDLSTIERTGDATLSATPTSVTINLQIGLGNVGVYFDQYKASCGSVKVSGDIRVSSNQFSMAGQLTLHLDDDECIAVLDYVKVVRMENIEVHITGLGLLNWVGDQLLVALIEYFKGEEIRERVEEEISANVKKVLAKKEICKYFIYV